MCCVTPSWRTPDERAIMMNRTAERISRCSKGSVFVRCGCRDKSGRQWGRVARSGESPDMGRGHSKSASARRAVGGGCAEAVTTALGRPIVNCRPTAVATPKDHAMSFATGSAAWCGEIRTQSPDREAGSSRARPSFAARPEGDASELKSACKSAVSSPSISEASIRSRSAFRLGVNWPAKARIA